MLLVTFHGGSNGYTNVHCYADAGHDTGKCVEDHVLQGDWPAHDDAELRGIGLYQNNLWVANGAKGSRSDLMIFQPSSGNQYTYVSTFVDSKTTSAVDHPFAFSFDGSGNCYLSNQDTNVVACFLPTGTPSTVPTCLPSAPSPDPNYNPGTFVATNQGGIDGTPATVTVPLPQGLDSSVSGSGKLHSVRDVLWYPSWPALLVCDEAAAAVKVYDANGAYQASITTGTDGPTHLAVQPSSTAPVLYISSGANVYSYDLPASAPQGSSAATLVASITGLQSAAGMSFDGSDTLYLADRDAKAIYRYAADSEGRWKQSTIVDGLKDNPEFVYHL